jgi:hypothetical protein
LARRTPALQLELPGLSYIKGFEKLSNGGNAARAITCDELNEKLT